MRGAQGGRRGVLLMVAASACFSGMAAFATAGQLFMTHAYQADEAPGVAAAGYASVVFSMLLGWLIWTEVPSTGAWLGGGLVVGSGMLLVRSRR